MASHSGSRSACPVGDASSKPSSRSAARRAAARRAARQRLARPAGFCFLATARAPGFGTHFVAPERRTNTSHERPGAGFSSAGRPTNQTVAAASPITSTRSGSRGLGSPERASTTVAPPCTCLAATDTVEMSTRSCGDLNFPPRSLAAGAAMWENQLSRRCFETVEIGNTGPPFRRPGGAADAYVAIRRPGQQ